MWHLALWCQSPFPPSPNNEPPFWRVRERCIWSFDQSSFLSYPFNSISRNVLPNPELLGVLQIKIEMVLSTPSCWLRIQFSGVCYIHFAHCYLHYNFQYFFTVVPYFPCPCGLCLLKVFSFLSFYGMSGRG